MLERRDDVLEVGLAPRQAVLAHRDRAPDGNAHRRSRERGRRCVIPRGDDRAARCEQLRERFAGEQTTQRQQGCGAIGGMLRRQVREHELDSLQRGRSKGLVDERRKARCGDCAVLRQHDAQRALRVVARGEERADRDVRARRGIAGADVQHRPVRRRRRQVRPCFELVQVAADRRVFGARPSQLALDTRQRGLRRIDAADQHRAGLGPFEPSERDHVLAPALRRKHDDRRGRRQRGVRGGFDERAQLRRDRAVLQRPRSIVPEHNRPIALAQAGLDRRQAQARPEPSLVAPLQDGAECGRGATGCERVTE